MNGIIIALIAQIIIGISLVIDKTFLKEKIAGNVFAYVFWIGLFNFFAIFVAPFDLVRPTFTVGLLAFGAGVFFLLSLIFYYQALQNGEASQTLALLGGFTPLATILFSGFFLKYHPNPIELFFLVVLTLGGFLMFLSDSKKFKSTFHWIILTTICLALLNVMQKSSYVNNFLTSFAIMKFGTFSAAMALLLVPDWRRKIFNRTKNTSNKNKALYLINRGMAGSASVMLSYAINLDNPGLIEATSGIKYVIIFIFCLMLTIWWPKILKENFKRRVLITKIAATVLITFSLTAIMIQRYYEEKPKLSFRQMTWGVSFSQKMSENFGLDWKENYQAILHDLKPKGIRLIAYWDLIEPGNDAWNFDDLDYQVDEANKYNVPVIIAVGQKVPRWPECHIPAWADKNSRDRQQELLDYEQKVIQRYSSRPNLLYWQVENEPNIKFGNCPRFDNEFYLKEISLARKLDPKRPILLTDGGERGRWYKQIKNGDVFGTTLYRKVYNKNFGSIYFPLTPEYYSVKTSTLKFISSERNHLVIISELGLEPWWNKQIYEIPIDQQENLFSNKDFADFTDFARRTDIDTAYMWGAEWWYFIKSKGNDTYWMQAQELIESGK